MSASRPQPPLRFAHIGDLHITEAGRQNHTDLNRIVDDIASAMRGRLDFVVLPGDIADDGTEPQFRLAHEAMTRLGVPWHAIPGDHDFKPRALEAFYRVMDVRRLPYAIDAAGCRCLFLDVVSQGAGGPDFRLGADGLNWLRHELAGARSSDQRAVVFMHTYPADLGEEAAAVTQLLSDGNVALVDMGHTHYNELANDGHAIYAATRSTGQVEEGEVGFSVATVDGGKVAWRFKPLDRTWPFVMITAPADRRLALGHGDRVVPGAPLGIRAAVWARAPLREVALRIDAGPWQPMAVEGDGIFAAEAVAPAERFTVSVSATDQNGHSDTDSIEVSSVAPPPRAPVGGDAARLPPWPERHILGTQLGPNRNGRKW